MSSLEDIEAVRKIARRFAARYPTLDPDDLTQDGLMRLDDRRHRFDPARGTWRTFANSCVRNAFRDAARREAYRLRHLLPLDDTRHGDIACPRTLNPERVLAFHQTRQHVRRLVGWLHAAEVDVVHLMLEGCEDKQIARITGRSVESIHTARCRAIPRLRRLLTGLRAA